MIMFIGSLGFFVLIFKIIILRFKSFLGYFGRSIVRVNLGFRKIIRKNGYKE